MTAPLDLRTQRLWLREVEPGDVAAFFRFESDPEVVRYQDYAPRTLAETRAYVNSVRADARVWPRVVYETAVLLDAEVVGRCGLQLASAELREARLWYTVRRDLWGRGVATEAARALVTHAFAALRVRRVVAECDPRNLGSARVLEKLGLRREGHFRECLFIKGEWVDSVEYAILAREWPP